MFKAYEQDPSGWVKHVFESRDHFSRWMKLYPGKRMVPINQVYGRCFSPVDHVYDLELVEEDPMYQQPLFVDVHQVKEEAQTSEEIQAPSATMILPDEIDKVYEEYKATCSDALLKKFNGRLERAVMIAKEGKVRLTSVEGVYEVASQKVKGASYIADIKAHTCDCPDAKALNICKHRMAAWFVEQVLFRNPDKVFVDETPTSDPEPDFDRALDDVFSKIVFHRVNPRVIWGMLDYEGATVPVEIQEYNGEKVFVQALPNFINGKFVPCFPFSSDFGTDVPYSSTWVNKEQLAHIKVYGGDNGA